MNKSKNDIVDLSFDEAMAELEAIVERLDKGDIGLEASMELYQQGVGLAKLCAQKLEAIEKKIHVLTDDEKQDDEGKK